MTRSASFAQQLATARDRVRRYRARKQAGVVRVTVDLFPPFVADLVALGWLTADKRDNPGAVNAALVAFTRHAWRASRQAPTLFVAPTR